ncbi:MAG: response regulator [Candidatus Marinimicrobia bacterium]|nr:response regulator [Candidatus Neomarinimicrobiota bacterium]MCF7840142.1 response regulator [Candidatus Neomarinimicrobiota bacterium]
MDKPKVLVVEDDFATQQFMKFLLRNKYDVVFAASSEEVDQVLADNLDIAAILMDVSLRGSEDGLMITERLRQTEEWATVPIIAVTAHAFPSDQKLAMESGCNEYISKPIDQAKLFEMMDDLISQES